MLQHSYRKTISTVSPLLPVITKGMNGCQQSNWVKYRSNFVQSSEQRMSFFFKFSLFSTSSQQHMRAHRKGKRYEGVTDLCGSLSDVSRAAFQWGVSRGPRIKRSLGNILMQLMLSFTEMTFWCEILYRGVEHRRWVAGSFLGLALTCNMQTEPAVASEGAVKWKHLRRVSQSHTRRSLKVSVCLCARWNVPFVQAQSAMKWCTISVTAFNQSVCARSQFTATVSSCVCVVLSSAKTCT